MRKLEPVKTEPRCAVCKEGEQIRSRVDAILERRGDSPDVPSWEAAAKLAGALIGDTITVRSLRRHQDGHCRIVPLEEVEAVAEREATEEAEASAETEDALALFDRILGEGWRFRIPTPEQFLDLQRALYVRGMRQDIKDGRQIRLTHDQVQRAIAEQTKRKTSETQNVLLESLGAAVGAFTQEALGGADVAGELEAAEVEDAEFSEVPTTPERGDSECDEAA